MIREIGVEIQNVLAGRGCPFKVINGPEPTTTATYARERIVLEHDEDSSDSYRITSGTYVNPKPIWVVAQAYKIRIYAQSPSAGALPFEHRRRAEHVRDMLIVALYEVAKIRKNGINITGGKFVQPADLENSEQIRGAVYELKLTWERGVRTLTWAGDARPEATIGGVGGVVVNGCTDVTIAGSEGSETACGECA